MGQDNENNNIIDLLLGPVKILVGQVKILTTGSTKFVEKILSVGPWLVLHLHNLTRLLLQCNRSEGRLYVSVSKLWLNLIDLTLWKMFSFYTDMAYQQRALLFLD